MILQCLLVGDRDFQKPSFSLGILVDGLGSVLNILVGASYLTISKSVHVSSSLNGLNAEKKPSFLSF